MIPYGPGPAGRRRRAPAALFGSSRPTSPLWPVNQRTPRRSNVAVFRFADAPARGKRIAPDPPRPRVDAHDRVQAAVRDPRCAVRPDDDAVRRGAGSKPHVPHAPSLRVGQPSSPEPCAVYQTPPSRAGATSCGREPAGTGYSRTSKPPCCPPAASGLAAARTNVAATKPDSRRARTDLSLRAEPPGRSPACRPAVACLASAAVSQRSRLAREVVSEGVARRRKGPQKCPKCVPVFNVQTTLESYFAGLPSKPRGTALAGLLTARKPRRILVVEQRKVSPWGVRIVAAAKCCRSGRFRHSVLEPSGISLLTEGDGS